MQSPTAALMWEIWRRNRRWTVLTIAIVVFGSIVHLIFPGRKFTEVNGPLSALYSVLGLFAILLVFGMFNYTEPDMRSGSSGFPRRLFTLPVSTLRLVAIPILLGVSTIELLNLAATKTIDNFNGVAAIKLGAFMVVYQTVLWTFSRLGALRPLALGFLAIWFIFVGFDLRSTEEPTPAGVASQLVPLALASFAVAWFYVANQRSGGGRLRVRSAPSGEKIAIALPRQTRALRSPVAAQFWMEWRRAGVVLPICVGVLLIAGIGPLCWWLRKEADSELRILVAILAMPIVLALPIGKGFSKPDFWSTELTLPSFMAVRPLSTTDFIATKMKVAAMSSAIAWLLTLMFLAIWLPFIANLDVLNRAAAVTRSLYAADAFYAPGVIAILFVVALMLLTWRSLVGGLWIGLSGSRRLFELSAAPYGVIPVFGLIALVVLSRRSNSIFNWAQANLDRFLPTLSAVLVATLLLKLTITALTLRRITRHYFAFWLVATGLLVALVLLLSKGLGSVLPSSSIPITIVLLLISLQLVPLARLGLASSLFEKNRHR